MKKHRGNAKRYLIALLATTLSVGALSAIQTITGVNLPAAKADTPFGGLGDKSFNDQGYIRQNVATQASAGALAAGPNGTSMVAMTNGLNFTPTTIDLLRFTSAGQYDISWGIDPLNQRGGLVVFDLATVIPTATRAIARDLFVDAQNRTYLLSQIDDHNGTFGAKAFNVTRFLPNGTIDGTFGSITRNFSNGGLSTGISDAYAIAVNRVNGFIFVAGSEDSDTFPNQPIAVVQMFDPSMSSSNTQVKLSQTDTAFSSVWKDIAIDPSGRVVATGGAGDPSDTDPSDTAVMRYVPVIAPMSITADATFAVGNTDHTYAVNSVGTGGESGVDIDVAPDSRVVVAVAQPQTGFGGILLLSAAGGSIPSWNINQPLKTLPGTRRPSGVAFDHNDSSKIMLSVMGGGSDTHNQIERYTSTGSPDNTYGISGSTDYQFGGSQITVPPLLAIDNANRAVTLYSDVNVQMTVRRFTTDLPPGPLAPTKVLFDESTVNPFTRVMLGTDPAGLTVATLNNPNFGTMTTRQPAADAGGALYYSFVNPGTNGAQPFIAVANASEGTPAGVGNSVDDPIDAAETRPSVSNVSPDVAYLRTLAGETCIQLYDPYNNPTPHDPIDGPICGVTDAMMSQDGGGTNQIAYVKGGNVFLTYGVAPDVQLSFGNNATRVEWGQSGTGLLYDSGPNQLTLLGFPGDAAINPASVGQITHTLVGVSGPITGFALDPDGGENQPIMYSAGNKVLKTDLVGSAPITLYIGTNPVVSQWQRSFSIYAPGGSNFDLSLPAVKAKDVPFQSKAPKNASQHIETSKLLLLNLLKSPLFQVNLSKSKLLLLNLLKSKLLLLNLLKSKLLLLNLLKSPLVDKGLRQTSLASLPINEDGFKADNNNDGTPDGGWIDRLLLLNTGPSNALAKLPLTQITLADVAGLGDAFNMPGLGEVDLEHSRFGSVSVMPFLLGNTPVSAIHGIDWCPVFEARGFPDCGRALGALDPANPGQTLSGLTATLLSLQIAGFNLDNLPKTDPNPNKFNDLRAVHWEDVDFDADAVITKFVLFSADPEGGVNTHDTSVGGALVKEITPDPHAVVYCLGDQGIPIGTIGVDCVNGTDTLDTAFINHAIRADKTVGNLGDALDGLSVNEIALGLWGNPGDDPYDQPPGALGLNASGNGKTFVLSFSRLATGPGTSSQPDFGVDLPANVKYTPNTSRYINTNGGSQAEIIMGDPVISNGGSHLQWHVPTFFDGDSGGFLQVLFDTSATGEVNGPATASFSDGFLAQQVTGASVSTTDASEVGNTPLTAGDLEPDTLYFGRIDSKTDVDYYKIPTNLTMPAGDPIPPGSTVTVYLSQLQYDSDLVVYHPDGGVDLTDPLRPPGGDPAIQTKQDPTVKVYNAGEPLEVEGDSDVPLLPGVPVAGLSSHRGNQAERVEAISWGAGPPYIIQVSGFAGAFGTDTYAVRYTVTPPPAAPTSVPRVGFANTPVLTASLAPGDPDVDTVILTNMGRVEKNYPGEAAGLQTRLDLLKTSTNAAIIPVDGVLSSVGADVYSAWDADPTNPDRANDVVRAINGLVDTVLNTHRGNLKSIIIVGSDEIIPMSRLADLTNDGNESTFAQDLRDTAAGDKNNALLGAALAGRILSDDPYGSFNPRAFGGTWLYVPDVALGRLVETPAQMGATIDEFRTAPDADTPAGSIRPTATLAAGYGFMDQLTRSIRDAFAAQFPGLGVNNVSMFDSWNDAAILNAVTNGGNVPSLISINAHYAPNAFGPATGTNNVSANQFTSAADLRRKLLFTMGCHSGFNITNYLQKPEFGADFPEATANEPVGAFIGNTGYGIGVDGVTAFSQQLFADFAYLIGSAPDLGTALTRAKQEYLATGVTNPYDYKVIAQATYFGIPQYRIVGATPVPLPPHPPNPFSSPANGGKQTSSLKIQAPTSGPENHWTLEGDPATGQHYELHVPGAGSNVSAYRPVQTSVKTDVTVAGLEATGAFLTSLKIAGDTPNFNPVLASPVIDSAANEPEAQFGDLVFPSNPVKITKFRGPDGDRQRAVVTMDQFSSTGFDAIGNMIGIDRRFSEVGYDVVYKDVAAPADPTPPILTNPEAFENLANNNTEFSVTVTDPESDILRAAILYRSDTGNGDFTLGNLTKSSCDPATHSCVFKGTFNVTGHIDYIAEALADSVGFTSNKGHLYSEVIRPVNTNTVAVSYDRAPDSGSAFYNTSPVKVILTENPSGTIDSYTDQVDNGPVGPSTPYPAGGIPLSSLGTHHITYTTEDGITGTVDVVITTRPAEVVSVTYDRSPDAIATSVYTAAVTATVHTSDPTSTISIKADNEANFTERDSVTFSTEGTHSFVYQTSLGAGNGASPEVVTIDLNAPIVIATTPPAGTPTYQINQVVLADYSCTDTFLLTCAAPVPSGTAIETSTLGLHAFTITATDQGGRAVGVHRPYNVVDHDVVPPTIVWTNPAAGTPTYTYGASVSALFTCADTGGSGVASCVGSQASGSPLNTATVTGAGQTRSVTVTAKDNLDNSTTETHAYKVQYADGTPCEGSLSHRVNLADPVNVPKGGQVVSVTFRICDAQGVAIGNNRYPTIASPIESNGSGVKGSCSPILGLIPLCLPLLSPTDNSFIYQSNHEWRFRQNTSGLSVGMHTFFIRLNDGTQMSYRINVLP